MRPRARHRSFKAAVAGAVMLAPLMFGGAAHAGTGGTVNVFVEDSSSFRVDGVCLDVITPGKKNTPDVVVASSAGSGTDGMTGHITMANVPAGSWIGKYYNCGNPSLSFVPFYTGLTLNKSKATPFGVTDGGLTDLGTQLLLPTGNGWIDGDLLDVNNAGIPSVSVTAYSANGKSVLDRSCSDPAGHFTSFNLPTNVGGVKLFFGSGNGCSNDGNFKTTWYGGTSFANALAVPITDATSNPVNPTTMAYANKGAVTVSSVTFSGTSSDPTITINGTGFGAKAPKPSPSGRPCGEPDVAATGYDYGSKLVVQDTLSPDDWQAGFPGDCIGLVIESYSTTQITLQLGSFYGDPSQTYRQMTTGDTFSVRVKGTALTGTITGLP